MSSPLPRHWQSAAQALAAVRHEPGLTRAELGRRLGLASGPTSDLVKRLTAAELISERRATAAGRGRPTTTVHAAPYGPVAVVLDVRHADWRLGTCGVDGVVDVVATGSHDGRPRELLEVLKARIADLAGPLGARVVGLGVSVPAPTPGDRLVQAAVLGWRDVDLSAIAPHRDLPVVVANDATMAAVAEGRLHTPRPRTLLHVVVEIGIGGALIVDGRPVASAHGLQGEFGHLPFGDTDAQCSCGARGCWSTCFDVPDLARALGGQIPADPRNWLHDMLTAEHASAKVRRLRERLAADLGRGVAGLVNALDPDAVTLGGLAPEVRSAAEKAFDDALLAGLMYVHREQPPAVVTARAGADAALIGVALSVFDEALDAEWLTHWSCRTPVDA